MTIDPGGFALLDGSGIVLTELPPQTRIMNELGIPDPYTWTRAPFSGRWRALGDGIPRTRPLLALGGVHHFDSTDEAIQAGAEWGRAVRLAASVSWRGRHLADLHPDVPGHYSGQHGDTYFALVAYTLTLNLTDWLTPERLQEVQQL